MPRTSVISAFINDNASGAVGPDGTQYYVELTIQSSQVSSDLTNFPVYVDLSDMPAVFFTNVQSDGGDIRVTESDGTTRCAVDLVSIDTSGSTGELHFLASSLSSSSDTTFRIYYSTTGTSSQPGVATTYGRNAVWADYEAVWHMEEDPSGSAPQMTDSTGNSHNLTSEGSMTSGDLVTGKLGNSVDLDGSDDGFSAGTYDPGLSGSYAITAWVAPNAATANTQIFAADTGTGGYRIVQFRVNSDGTLQLTRLQNSPVIVLANPSSTASIDDGTFRHVAGVFDTTAGTDLYINGSNDGSDASTTASQTSAVEVTVGLRQSGEDRVAFFDGKLDEVRYRLSALSADWIASEYTNQNTPTTFYTVGSQTAV